ncbi:GGDEF domain-containing protein [Psychromonas sp. MME2]|uniref:GGDEF domain-containing protein n=1 Tax=Psychromonas sp. MME2 TaxID=3231033 RepID=UPI00339BC66F
MQGNILSVVFNASAWLLSAFIAFVVILFLAINYYIRQLRENSCHDGLTLLYNKRFLTEMLPRILKKQLRLSDQQLVVTFIDIDHFKQINDAYGHDYGDRVLKNLAALITNKTRPDDYCIRYGGEEFVIVGFYQNKESAFHAMERLRKAVSRMVCFTKKKKFSITISAGIAIHDNKNDFDVTMKQADEMLYLSKKSGRNCTSL